MDTWERLFGLDAQLIFDAAITGINILILFWVLAHFLFEPVKNFLQDRQEKVMTDLESAKEQREAAAIQKKEYEEKLTHAQQRAQEILQEAKARAEKKEDELLAEAKEKAERLLRQAHESIVTERAKAEEQMRKQYVEEAAKMALKVLQGNLSQEMQREILKHSLTGMEGFHWKN